MRLPAKFLFCLLIGIFSTNLAGQTPDFGPLDSILQRASERVQTDIKLIVIHRGEVVYDKQTFNQGPEPPRVLPIASASKWLSAATILTLADDGLLDIDDPVALYLPYFRGEKAEITIKQLLSHTSGFAGDFPCVFQEKPSLDGCARQIAGTPILYKPGWEFHYGDAPFQVAGRIAEMLTGKSWEDLFQERMAGPLGMADTTYLSDQPTANPSIAAGALSSAGDYARFLLMLRNRGTLDGVRVLSERSVDLLLADQRAGATIPPYFIPDNIWKPFSHQNRYGLGNWLENAEDLLPNGNSSRGAFGVSPFLDRQRDLAFVAFLKADAGEFARHYFEIQSFLEKIYPIPEIVASREPEFRSLTTVDGVRTWFEYVPDGCLPEDAQCPLLIALHPNGTNGVAFAQSTGLIEKAERERFILALPNGLAAALPPLPVPQNELAWSLPEPPGDFGSPDEIGFVFGLSAVLENTHRVDPARIYLAGYKEGADLALLTSCNIAERFAGVAALDPEIGFNSWMRVYPGAYDCRPRERVPAFSFEPGISGESGLLPNVPGWLVWNAENRCQLSSAQLNDFLIPRASYSESAGCWPGTSVRNVTAVPTIEGWPANGWDLAWDFLGSYHRPGVRPAGVIPTSAASFVRRIAAPASLISLFGANLAEETVFAPSSPFPTQLGGVRAEVRDQFGVTHAVPLSFVSPLQINGMLPEGTAPGPVSLFVYRGTELSHRDWLYVDDLAPALFTVFASGDGPAAGEVLYVHSDGSRESQPLARPVQTGEGMVFDAVPVELGRPDTQVFLTLYGTGWRRSGTGTEPKVRLNGTSAQTIFAGPQGQFDGLDQINVRIDGLEGLSGTVRVSVVSGVTQSNVVTLVVN